MKQKKNNLLENHLMVLDQLNEIHIDDFFYTRLKSKMESEKVNNQFELPMKPMFILTCLGLMLIVNIIFLNNESFPNKRFKNDKSIEQIIFMYDQNINSLY